MILNKEQSHSVIAEKLYVSFSGRSVIRNLSVNIASGNLTVIVGKSGAGKSTFLQSLNRLNDEIRGAKTLGNVKLKFKNGVIDIYKDRFPVEELRRRVGMVFQTPHPLPTSIEKNLSLPLKLVLNIRPKGIPDRIQKALTIAQLWDEVKDRLKDPAVRLSGGQQQRLCLARTLALEPEILLLDEPTASLDFKASEKIEELLTELKKDYTIIAVSHSLRQARRIADRILIMKEGTIVAALDPPQFQQKEVFENLLEEIF